MPDSDNIEQQFQISKSSMTTYQASSLVLEYLIKQNETKNPEGHKFILQLEEIARETIQHFGLPENYEDLDQIHKDFQDRVISAVRAGLLGKKE